ncbi:hypothetical protein [Brevibacillus sp. SYSU BS000544]|uniref:hypothetical protein n=1 Tax=Brevibacillus sp. SYSU BS000544 TaxID=3416443 RepID=UPI003CE5A290
MSTRKWRNPYTPINKKVDRTVIGQAKSSIAITPHREAPQDLRASVLKMRDNIKGISSTIRQMEETMDTIYGAIEMLDTLGKRTSKASPSPNPGKQKSQKAFFEDEVAPESSAQANTSGLGAGSGLGNALSNIDIGQLISILQSPLVQNLLSQPSTTSKRKKEG